MTTTNILLRKYDELRASGVIEGPDATMYKTEDGNYGFDINSADLVNGILKSADIKPLPQGTSAEIWVQLEGTVLNKQFSKDGTTGQVGFVLPAHHYSENVENEMRRN